MADKRVPLIEVREISKYFGSVIAPNGVSMSVYPGEVMCLLGDNGVRQVDLDQDAVGRAMPSEGQYLVEGKPVDFDSLRDAQPRHRHGLPGSGHDSAFGEHLK
ncbi:MAG: hypothetical protein R3A10_07580 [Caldilineaceae bacterium]